MKKRNYIKPLTLCYPYEENIVFAAGSTKKDTDTEYDFGLRWGDPYNKEDPNNDPSEDLWQDNHKVRSYKREAVRTNQF